MPTALIDTHAHLTSRDLFDRRAQVVADARAAGVTRIIEVACTPADLEPALQLRREYPGQIALAVGIHPHEAGRVTAGDIERFVRLWREDADLVAVGEIGLDYHYDFAPRDLQRTIFRKQLDAASSTPLPIVIHSREAYDDTVAVLKDAGYVNRKVVFHCYGGTPDQAAEIRALGWWTSFTGVITFKNADALRRTCLETPPDMIMFETDCPYMTPEPIRRVRPNEPQYITHTVRLAANLRGVAFEELARQSTANAARFFSPA